MSLKHRITKFFHPQMKSSYSEWYTGYPANICQINSLILFMACIEEIKLCIYIYIYIMTTEPTAAVPSP
jgi:hypothetical protein